MQRCSGSDPPSIRPSNSEPAPAEVEPRLPLTAASCIIRRSPADRWRSSIPITSYSCGAFDTGWWRWGCGGVWGERGASLRTLARQRLLCLRGKKKPFVFSVCPRRIAPHFNTLNGAQQAGQGASYYIGDPLTPDKTRQFVAATFAQADFPP